jgi:uncharacterized protein (TIGR02284 family)
MSNDFVKNLNVISQLLQDGYSCYKSHIENVKQPEMKKLFVHLCQQRFKMREEITSLIQSLGEKPSEGGTVVGGLHKFYENFKSIITQGDPLVISKEIKRGENMLLEEYKIALSKDLPFNVKDILFKQFNQVEDELKKTDMTSIEAVSNS